MSELLEEAWDRASGLLDRRIRIGVTGLSRSGKTVLLTALVHNLLHPDRLGGLGAVHDGRLAAAMLCPQPRPDVPRFDYEGALAALTGADGPPRWPEGTRRAAMLRLSLRLVPSGLLGRATGEGVIHLDLFDYPGEWLLDLPMMRQDFAEWSAIQWRLAESATRADLSADWRALVAATDPAAPAEEATARRLAESYTAFLHAGRDHDRPLSRLQPGRFLLPGDLAGSPMLTFCPLPDDRGAGRGSLYRLMAERYDAYRRHVVRPFFTEHFARLDAQIVLVDLLEHLAAGRDSLDDLAATLDDVLACFRTGASNWLWPVLGRRVTRVLFAATKADHLPRLQHERLKALMTEMLADARARTRFTGARVAAEAVASVRATTEVNAVHQGREMVCVSGVPLAGGDPVAVWPGPLPVSLARAGEGFRAARFAPPPDLDPGRGLPHLRLDKVVDFITGGRLA